MIRRDGKLIQCLYNGSFERLRMFSSVLTELEVLCFSALASFVPALMLAGELFLIPHNVYPVQLLITVSLLRFCHCQQCVYKQPSSIMITYKSSSFDNEHQVGFAYFDVSFARSLAAIVKLKMRNHVNHFMHDVESTALPGIARPAA